MSSLAVFSFESQDVRFVDGKPVANDVAAVLGYSDPAKTVSTKVSPKNKGVTKTVTPGGVQAVTVLEEPGIYQLIFSSKLESAERFQDWVFSEVLPSIRKTGSYSVPQPQVQYPQLPSRQLAVETAQAVDEINDLLRDTDPRLAQFLVDYAISDLMPSQPLLSGDRLRGVVEIAKEMGFPVTANNRSTLGRFVKTRCGHIAQQEQRLVNGTTQYVSCYPEGNEEVRKAIQDYFNK